MMHLHFFELRFLLHGSLNHYDRDDDLFIPDDSKDRDLWKIVADCILEPWQVIDPQLSPFIYSIKEQLKIKKLDRDDIIDRLGKDPHAAKNITHQRLTESQIIELLNQIYYCGDPKKSLWLNLVLHKTSEGRYVSVTGETYLESEDSVPKALENKIIIIKSIQGLHQNWISSWSNEIAIDKLIKLFEEDSFQDKGLIASDLLNLLSASNANQRKLLRKIQWVPSRSGSNVDYYAPEEVVIFNKDAKELVSEQLLAEFNNYGYCEISNLDTKYQSNATFQKLCSIWSYKELLNFLLKEISIPGKYVSEIYQILFKIEDSDLENNLKQLIKHGKKWITLKKSKTYISTSQIIYHKVLSSDSLSKPIIDEIVESIDGYYTHEDCTIDILKLYKHSKDLFLGEKDTFKILATGLTKISNFYIGKFDHKTLNLDMFLDVVESCSELKVLKIIQVDRKIFEEYFFLSVLQKIETTHVIKIINYIIDKPKVDDNKKVEIINEYLTQYTYSEQREILSSIKLLNKNNQWQATSELCDPDLENNISKENLLNLDKHKILSSYLKQLSQDSPVIQDNIIEDQSTAQLEEGNTKAKQLQQYFESWDVQADLIGIFIWLLAGDDPKTQDLARNKYLSCADISVIENSFNPNSQKFNGNIKINEQKIETITVKNILGNVFQAKINKNIKGHDSNLFTGSIKPNQIVIISLNTVDLDSIELYDILKNSITLICEKLFSHTIDSQIWNQIKDSWQIHTDVVQYQIICDSRSILKSFKIDNKDLIEKLDRWNNLYREYQEAIYYFQSSNQSKIQREMNEILQKISDLVTENDSVQRAIYEAVVKRISDDGYALGSIPLELFQNADDATLEYHEMLRSLDQERIHFHIIWDSETISVYHSGRPINCSISPNAKSDYKPLRQFKYDLLNMLSFRSSDKSEQETGKFGLGFKSVYLACSEPVVVSHQLQFSIKGGLIPFSKPISDPEIEELRRERMQFSDGTLIYLKIKPDIEVNDVFKDFKKLINLMLVFSKIIKNCTLEYPAYSGKQQKHEISWSPNNFRNSQRIQVGRVEFPDPKIPNTWESYNFLCFNLRSGSIGIILPKDLKKSYLSELPTFWVTAPTKEALNLRFVINARFSLTTGRTSLDRNATQQNLDLADQLGLEFFEALEELFGLIQTDGKGELQGLGIPNHKPEQLWEFLWDVLIIDWAKKHLDAKEITRDLNIQIIQRITAKQKTGLGKLIQTYKVLPSGIRPNHLVCLRDVRYYISGFLSDNLQILEGFLKQKDFVRAYPIDQIISSTTKSYLDRLFESHKYQEIRYASALKILIKNDKLPPILAKDIHILFRPDIIKSIKSNHRKDYQDLESKLSNLMFKSLTAEFQVGSKLLAHLTSSKEEKLLVEFAPDNLVLSHEYIDHQGLECFLAYRELQEITRPEYDDKDIFRWCLQANSESKQNGVINYLWMRGTFFSEIAKRLGEHIKNSSNYRFWGNSNEKLKRVIREILGESPPPPPPSPSPSPSPPPPEEILDKIYDWWTENRSELISKYEHRVYPKIDIDSKVSIEDTTNNGDSKQRWMILFMLGMFHTMGRQNEHQHRRFLENCHEYGWLSTFSESSSEYWLEVLETYFTDRNLHSNEEVLEYYQWLKNYPGIYALSKWFSAYQASFLELDKLKSSSWVFRPYLRPKTNPSWSGSGIANDAPPIDKILGIGANFILRELIRLGVIKNKLAHSYAYVPTGRFRGFLRLIYCPLPQKLDSWIDCSQQIYHFMREKLGDKKASFMNDFDIPFLILLREENKLLRIQLLGEDLVIESPSDDDSVRWPEKWITKDGQRIEIR